MTKTRYVIVETQPVYHWNTDALIGSRHFARWNLGTFETEAFACKRAAMVAKADYEGCGDSGFHVADASDPFRVYRAHRPMSDVDDMPF